MVFHLRGKIWPGALVAAKAFLPTTGGFQAGKSAGTAASSLDLGLFGSFSAG